jgi:hypothetical protein
MLLFARDTANCRAVWTVTDATARDLFRAMRRADFNRSAAGRLLGVSRETVRLRLKEVGGDDALIALAVRIGEASQAEAVALAQLAALAARNRQGANLEHGAKHHEIRHLTGIEGGRMLSASMSAVPTVIPQSSTVRLNGEDREFAKRIALEIALKLGLPREDMSEAVSRMIGYFRAAHGDEPSKVAEALIAVEKKPEQPAKRKREEKA